MITLAFFLISLQSLYFYQFSLPLYSIAGVFILASRAVLQVFAQRNRAINGIPGYFSALIFAPLFVLFLSLLAFSFQLKAETPRVFVFFVVFLIPLSYAVLSSEIDPHKITSYLVVFHSSVFIFQFILFFGLGIDFDPVDLLSDVTQRGWGGSLNHNALGAFRRLGGMYSEPGTYATYIAPLIAILFSYGERSKIENYTIGLGIITLVLSFSIFAWVFCLIIASFMISTSLKRLLAISAVFPAAVWIALPYIRYRFLDTSRSDEFSGISFREQIIDSTFIFLSDGLDNLVFGNGLLTTEVPFDYVGAINDAGLIFFLLFSCGLAGTFYFIFLISKISLRFGIHGVAIGLIILSSKIYIFAPMFWLILVLATHLGWKKHTKAVS